MGASSTTDSSPSALGTRLLGWPGTATQGPSLRPAFGKLETYCPLSPWGPSSEGRQLNWQFRCTLDKYHALEEWRGAMELRAEASDSDLGAKISKLKDESE